MLRLKQHSNTSFEYAVNPKLNTLILLVVGEILEGPLDLNLLGVHRAKAIEIFDNSGWK